jgi:hypothetical protein
MWGRSAAYTISVVAIAPGSADIFIGGSLVAEAKSLQSWLDFEGPFDLQLSTFDFSEFPGDHTARVTPVPIPNTEVKPRRADDTARVTVWERRSSPGLK